MDGTHTLDQAREDLSDLTAPPPVPPALDIALPMLDVYLPMMKAAALASAGRMGLFGLLADGPSNVRNLARRIGASEDGLARLIDFLIATGHLERDEDVIANAPKTRRWFTERGRVDYSPGLAWTAHAWAIMDDLPDAIQRGGPERILWDRMTDRPELGVLFSAYMRAFARHLSPDILALPGLPRDPSRLLDLGGSHGVHSQALCKRYPGLEAVIVDLASAVDNTRASMEAEGLGERIEVRSGDLRFSDWGDGYDIALYLSVAHNMDASENRSIFRRLGRVIRPGGILIIHDYPRETTPALFEAAFRLTLLVETGTTTCTSSELSEMLEEAGFATIRSVVLSPAEKGTLIVAKR